jgi:hypothetical protein
MHHLRKLHHRQKHLMLKNKTFCDILKQINIKLYCLLTLYMQYNQYVEDSRVLGNLIFRIEKEIIVEFSEILACPSIIEIIHR